MTESRIYSEFSDETLWMKKAVLKHALTLPKVLHGSADHYLSERLKILSNSSSSPSAHSKPGDLIPYVVFWLSKSFRCTRPANIRKLALALVYGVISATLIDDVMDDNDDEPNKKKSDYLLPLAGIYSNTELQLQREIFPPPSSSFWSIHSESMSDLARYYAWDSRRHESDDPMSNEFLEEASRYSVSLVRPALAGVAILAGREEMIEQISSFLKDFCMGWRIADDIWDWEIDLRMRNLNNSTVLHWIKGEFSQDRLTREMVLSAFLEDKWVSKIYERIFVLSAKAKADVRGLDCPYLEEFMDNWLAYHIIQRDSLLESRKSFQEKLTRLLLLHDHLSRLSPEVLRSSARS